jgi:hypothetical protein
MGSAENDGVYLARRQHIQFGTKQAGAGTDATGHLGKSVRIGVTDGHNLHRQIAQTVPVKLTHQAAPHNPDSWTVQAKRDDLFPGIRRRR